METFNVNISDWNADKTKMKIRGKKQRTKLLISGWKEILPPSSKKLLTIFCLTLLAAQTISNQKLTNDFLGKQKQDTSHTIFLLWEQLIFKNCDENCIAKSPEHSEERPNVHALLQLPFIKNLANDNKENIGWTLDFYWCGNCGGYIHRVSAHGILTTTVW